MTTKLVGDSARPKPPRAGMGRPKGSPNKSTKAIKEMILEALDKAHKEGGVGYLKDQADKNPVAFMALVGKVLPLQVSGDPENPLIHEIRRAIVRPDNPNG